MRSYQETHSSSPPATVLLLSSLCQVRLRSGLLSTELRTDLTIEVLRIIISIWSWIEILLLDCQNVCFLIKQLAIAGLLFRFNKAADKIIIPLRQRLVVRIWLINTISFIFQSPFNNWSDNFCHMILVCFCARPKYHIFFLYWFSIKYEKWKDSCLQGKLLK